MGHTGDRKRIGGGDFDDGGVDKENDEEGRGEYRAAHGRQRVLSSTLSGVHSAGRANIECGTILKSGRSLWLLRVQNRHQATPDNASQNQTLRARALPKDRRTYSALPRPLPFPKLCHGYTDATHVTETQVSCDAA